MQKMGWSAGQGLGRSNQGRTDPIEVSLRCWGHQSFSSKLEGVGKFLGLSVVRKENHLESDSQINRGSSTRRVLVPISCNSFHLSVSGNAATTVCRARGSRIKLPNQPWRLVQRDTQESHVCPIPGFGVVFLLNFAVKLESTHSNGNRTNV